MSDWANLAIEEKLTRPPVRRDVGPEPKSEPERGSWILANRAAEMDYRLELSEFMQLGQVYQQDALNGVKEDGRPCRAAWQTLVATHRRTQKAGE